MIIYVCVRTERKSWWKTNTNENMKWKGREGHGFRSLSTAAAVAAKKKTSKREGEREKNLHAQLTQKRTNVLRVLQIKEVAEEKRPLTTDAEDEDEAAENCGEWRLCDETMPMRERTHSKIYLFISLRCVFQ